MAKIGNVCIFGLFPLYLRQFYDFAAFWTADLSVMNIFFDFFSLFDLAGVSLDELRKTAMVQVCATIYFFTGNDTNCSVSRSRIEQAFHSICNGIDHKEDDFFNASGLSSALNFLGSLPDTEASFCVTTVGELIFVSPKEITNIVLRHLDRLSGGERLQCSRSLFNICS
jgi:hypothetical protein